MAPKELEKKLRKEEKAKKAITVKKKKEIVQKYESGVRVTDLANMYSMSRSTISQVMHIIQPFFIMKRLGKGALGVLERIMGIYIISYGENSLD
jgi:sorbitol-specific phosphotransferase system component IIBC